MTSAGDTLLVETWDATADTAEAEPDTSRSAAPRFASYIGDVRAITWRNLLLMRREPVGLVFLTIQPMLFVILFRFVFGRAMELVIGVSYIQYLMPGIFAQTVCFGAMGTGIGVATDMRTGMIDRFRTLPMSPSAVLIGRTLADLARNLWAVGLMFLVGWLLGFEVWGAWPDFLLGVGSLLSFGYALQWVFLYLGLAGKPERVFALAFPLAIPLVFLSTAFVPTSLLPEWIGGFARNQPVSQAVESIRHAVFGGAEHAYTVNAYLWSIGLLAVIAPLAARRFRRAR